jgi:hypothetical protein
VCVFCLLLRCVVVRRFHRTTGRLVFYFFLLYFALKQEATKWVRIFPHLRKAKKLKMEQALDFGSVRRPCKAGGHPKKMPILRSRCLTRRSPAHCLECTTVTGAAKYPPLLPSIFRKSCARTKSSSLEFFKPRSGLRICKSTQCCWRLNCSRK